MVDCVVDHSDHTRLHQHQDAHHVVDGVVDGLNDLLLPFGVAIAGSSRTVVHVIHVYSPEIVHAINSILHLILNFVSQK